MSHADASSDDLRRLREFWNTRYQAFSLSESGWAGAGESFNRFVYRCKSSAVVRALATRGITSATAFSVLDAGCGQGYFADDYGRRYPRASYTGLDLSRRVVDHLRRTRPSLDVHEGDLATWTPAPSRRFDVIQCLEVLHLILDDDGVRRGFQNFARLVAPQGVVLVTARPGEDDIAPSGYLRFRPESQLRRWWREAGLEERGRVRLYYWMPDRGPSWRVTQPMFFRLPPALIYAADRLALRLRLPAPATGPDSRTELVVLGRSGARTC